MEQKYKTRTNGKYVRPYSFCYWKRTKAMTTNKKDSNKRKNRTNLPDRENIQNRSQWRLQVLAFQNTEHKVATNSMERKHLNVYKYINVVATISQEIAQREQKRQQHKKERRPGELSLPE